MPGKHLMLGGFLLSLVLILTNSCAPSAAVHIQKQSKSYVTVTNVRTGSVFTVEPDKTVRLRPFNKDIAERQTFYLDNVFDGSGNPVFFLENDSLYVKTSPQGFTMAPAEQSLDYLFTGNLANKEDSTQYSLYRPVTSAEVLGKLREGENKEIPTTWLGDGDRVFLGIPPKANVPTTQSMIWAIRKAQYVPYRFEKDSEILVNRTVADTARINTRLKYYLANRFDDRVLTFSEEATGNTNRPVASEKKGATTRDVAERTLLQQFHFKPVNANTFAIVNEQSGKYLTYMGYLEGDGLPVYEQDPSETAHQHFVFEPGTAGYQFHRIRAKNAYLYLTQVEHNGAFEYRMLPPDDSEAQEFDLMETDLFEWTTGVNGIVGNLQPRYFKYGCRQDRDPEACAQISTILIKMNTKYVNFQQTGKYEYRYRNTEMRPSRTSAGNVNNTCCSPGVPSHHKIRFNPSGYFTFLEIERIYFRDNKNVPTQIKVVGVPKNPNYYVMVGKPRFAPLKLPDCKILCWRAIGDPAPEGMVGLGALYAVDNETLQKQIAFQAYAVTNVVVGFAVNAAVPSGGGVNLAARIAEESSSYFMTVGTNYVVSSTNEAVLNGVIDHIDTKLQEEGLPPGISGYLSLYDPTGLFDLIKAFYLPDCDCEG